MKYLMSAAYGVVALLFMLSLNASAVVDEALVQAQPIPQNRRLKKTAGRPKARIDYSQFSHHTHVDKEKPACDSCHKFPTTNWNAVREGDAAFPDVVEFPEHGSCLNCHRQQFFARQRPAPAICSNCHVNVTPQNTARLPFPSLGEAFLSTTKARDFVSDFQVAFPHEKHADAECSDCHPTNPPKQTRPLNHALCFNCHNQESELAPLPPNCDACHKQ